MPLWETVHPTNDTEVVTREVCEEMKYATRFVKPNCAAMWRQFIPGGGGGGGGAKGGRDRGIKGGGER